MALFTHDDPILQAAVRQLVRHYKCHTVLLFGSRANGTANKNSDYDLVGITATGNSNRLGKIKAGAYLDIHIYPDAHLRRLDDSFRFISAAVLLYSETRYGTNLIKRLRKLRDLKPRRMSKNQLAFEHSWIEKMLVRITTPDIEGQYRRYWLLYELPMMYFKQRSLHYDGSKEAFAWLKAHDPATSRAFENAFANPSNNAAMRHLCNRVISRNK